MDIGTQLADLKRRIGQLERASRLSSASLDDTALAVRDASGSLRALVGQQADGTTAVNVVNGPTPPTPTQPSVASVLDGIAVQWNGGFTGGEVTPLDFSRVEVHASTSSGFTPSAATLVTTIETPQGATVTVPTSDTVFVRLMTRNTSGTGSPASAQAGPISPAVVTGTKLAADAIDGRVITGSTVRTAATGERIELTPSGVIIIYNADGDVVVEIDADGYRLYDPSDGEIVAEVKLDAGNALGGFYTRNFSFPEHTYSFLAGGKGVFGPVENSLAAIHGYLDYAFQPYTSPPYTAMTLSTGIMDIALDKAARVQLVSERGQRPKVWVDGGSGSALADLIVTGGLSVGSTAWTAYTPVVTGAGTPTWTTRTGWYRIIGDEVFFNAYLVVGATAGTGATAISITAPTLIDRTTRQIVPANGDAMTGNSGSLQAVALTGTATNVFDRIRNSTGSNVNGSALVTGATIAIQGSYRRTV